MTNHTADLLYALRRTLETAGIDALLIYGSDTAAAARVANPDDTSRAIGALDLDYVDQWVDDQRRTVAEGLWTFRGRRAVVTLYGPEKKVSE